MGAPECGFKGSCALPAGAPMLRCPALLTLAESVCHRQERLIHHNSRSCSIVSFKPRPVASLHLDLGGGASRALQQRAAHPLTGHESDPAQQRTAPSSIPRSPGPGWEMSLAAESPYRQKRALDRADSSPDRQHACGKRLRRAARPQGPAERAHGAEAAHALAATARAALMGLFPELSEQVGAPGCCSAGCSGHRGLAGLSGTCAGRHGRAGSQRGRHRRGYQAPGRAASDSQLQSGAGAAQLACSVEHVCPAS